MNTNIINKKKLITSIIFKAISLIASVYGLVFTIDSIKSFTFFTTLSNVADMSGVYDYSWTNFRGRTDWCIS